MGGCGIFFRRAPESEFSLRENGAENVAEARHFLNAPPLFARFFEVGKRTRFEYIHQKAPAWSVSVYCRLLKVTPSGYAKYKRSLDKPYKYSALLANIKEILKEDKFNKTYGKKRIYEKLQLDYDCPYSYNTVAKVMRENGLLQKKKHPKSLTKADKETQKSDNLLNRDFTAAAPNKKTVTDITAFQASDGKLYASGLFDCYDNACLGVCVAGHMRAELVTETFIQASSKYDLRGCIAHSDRGSQYTSEAFRAVLKDLKMIQSMNSAAGRCHDNAKCESMWARGKTEILDCYNTKSMTCKELKAVILYYYMVYWNHRRICSAIGGVPPMVKRAAYYIRLEDAAA